MIELQLRNHIKKSTSRTATVRSIGEIDQWIQSVEDINATKPHPEARHKKMPSMQDLMRSWPKEIEDELTNGKVELPGADIDLSVEEYVRMM